MFHVEYRQFKQWENYEIDLSEGSLILLKGDSGSGKSSIIEGIVWCLYDVGANIYPATNKKAKTSVKISFNDLTIERRKNPCRLLVHYQNQLYEDKVAQEIINSLYGSYDIWSVGSYVPQGSRNLFLEMTNKNKMSLLSNLAFLDDDPSLYVEKIDKYISEASIENKIALGTYSQKVEEFKALTEGKNFKLLTDEEYEKHQEALRQTREIELLEEKERSKQVSLQIKQSLQRELESIPEIQLEPPNIINYENIDFNNPKLPLPFHSQVKRYQELKSERFTDSDFEHQDYVNALSLEKDYQTNKSLAEKLQVQYDRENVEARISQCEKIINDIEYRRIENEISKLKEEIQDLEDKSKTQIVPVSRPNLDIYDNSNLNKEVQQLSLKKDILRKEIRQCEETLECPHCLNKVNYVNGKLALLPGDVTELEKMFDKLSIDIDEVQNQIIENQRISKDLQSNYLTDLAQYHKKESFLQTMNDKLENSRNASRQLQDKLAKMTYYKTPENNLEKCENYLRALKSIKFLELPITPSDHILQCLTSSNLKKEFEGLNRQIPQSLKSVSYSDYCFYYQQLEDYYNKYIPKRKNDERRLDILKRLSEIVVPDEDYLGKIQQLRKEVEDSKDAIKRHQEALTIVEQRNKLAQDRLKLIESNNLLKDLNTLRHHIVDVQCTVLNELINSINSDINEICSQLFNEDIDIVLSMFKMIKSTKNIKHVVNFSIQINGVDYDFKNLSGGQKSRISLAVTLAFSRFSSSPFLLLDENLAGIEMDKCEVVAKILKNYPHMTSLVVLHNVIEGLFDGTILLQSSE